MPFDSNALSIGFCLHRIVVEIEGKVLRKEWTLNKYQTVSVGSFAFLIFVHNQIQMRAMAQMTMRDGYPRYLSDKTASAAQFLSLPTPSTQSYGKASQLILKL